MNDVSHSDQKVSGAGSHRIFLGRRATRNGVVVAIGCLVLVAAVGLAGVRHGWRLGVLGCDAVEGGYLCDRNGGGVDSGSGEMVVFAPGFVEGLDLLGRDVGWLALGTELFGLRLGVVDAPADQLTAGLADFITVNGGDAVVGFSLGGTAALRLAESGAVDRVAVGCAPTDLTAVVWRFVRMAEYLDGAGVVMPDPRLREDFDVWRASYDMFTLPMIDTLPVGLVDGWLDDLSMGWHSNHDRYLAIRSAVWLNANLQGRSVPDMARLTGDLKADLLLIHNEIDPVVPVAQMVGYQVMAGEMSTGDRITVRVIEGFGHCKLGPTDWLYLMRWLRE